MKNFYTTVILFFLLSCSHRTAKDKQSAHDNQVSESKSIWKPASVFSDTLKVNSGVAIFYYPDSLQLKKLRASSDTAKFDANMHEFEYQFRYTHTVLNKYWNTLPIVEAKKVRYLLFTKTDMSRQVIDLDTKPDPYGLFVFDPKKDPILLDMTNAESELSFYFLPNGPQKQK